MRIIKNWFFLGLLVAAPTSWTSFAQTQITAKKNAATYERKKVGGKTKYQKVGSVKKGTRFESKKSNKKYFQIRVGGKNVWVKKSSFSVSGKGSKSKSQAGDDFANEDSNAYESADGSQDSSSAQEWESDTGESGVKPIKIALYYNKYLELGFQFSYHIPITPNSFDLGLELISFPMITGIPTGAGIAPRFWLADGFAVEPYGQILMALSAPDAGIAVDWGIGFLGAIPAGSVDIALGARFSIQAAIDGALGVDFLIPLFFTFGVMF